MSWDEVYKREAELAEADKKIVLLMDDNKQLTLERDLALANVKLLGNLLKQLKAAKGEDTHVADESDG